MPMTDRPLVGAQEPAFQETDHSVQPGQQMLPFALATLNLTSVDVTFKAQIGSPSVTTVLPGSIALATKACRLALVRSAIRSIRIRPIPRPSF